MLPLHRYSRQDLCLPDLRTQQEAVAEEGEGAEAVETVECEEAETVTVEDLLAADMEDME